MYKLTSDSTQSEINTKVKEILRDLFIDEWQSEACHQHQNFAERTCQTIKRQDNTLLDRISAPALTWLPSMFYVCFILNYFHDVTIKIMLLNAATGSTHKTSPML